MNKIIQIVVGVLVAYAIVCITNYAYAGNNGPGTDTCQGSTCVEGDGTGVVNNYLGGAGGNGGNATIGDTTIRNKVDITNTNKLTNTLRNDITNTNSANANIGDIINKNVNSNTIGDITNTANGGNANADARANSKSTSTATGGNANATGGNANAEGGAGGDGGNAVAEGGQGGSSDVDVKFENPVQHITPAPAMKVDAALTDHGDKLSIKAKGSVWAHKQFFSYAQAQRLGNGASDAKIESGLFTTYKKTVIVSVVKDPGSAEFMGYLYILPDGPDCTLAQMEGKAMKAAMDAGGTHIIPDTDQGAYLEGSSWSIGFGGGASILSNGGQMAIAPNAGTGFGKAKSNNEMRPAIVVAVYRFEWPKQEVPYIPLDDNNNNEGR